MIPVERVRAIVDDWLTGFDTPADAYRLLESATGLKADTWRKRLTDEVYVLTRGTWRGWWSYAELDVADVDELLVAAGLTHLWHTDLVDLLPDRPGLRCEDCGKGPLGPGDYRPLDLMRPDPSASRWVWDATKRKPVFRPRNARVGGRRFRRVDLCRRCAAEALRQRAAADGATVMENGRRRHLRTKERLAPKRGGRPRLLDEQQLRALHRAYETRGLSIGDLARALVASDKIAGTHQGFYQSILYGWRNLGLPLRPKSESQRLAHHRRGRIPPARRHCKATVKRGKRRGLPCLLGPKGGSDYCVCHQPRELAAAA